MRDTECRPPEDTPDGTVCWLRGSGGLWEPSRWWTDPDGWELLGHDDTSSPKYLMQCGWRFHSIATPPEDKP